MSVQIRLQRFGKKDRSIFRIVAIEKAQKRNGKNISIIGYYNPTVSPPMLKINSKEFDRWTAKGAQPSSTVKKLLSSS
jgi:small subunit ribosomal protein S16